MAQSDVKMKDVRQMSYEEFAKLRFCDFFPVTDAYFDDDVGGTTCGIGYACVDGYGFTGFASPADQHGHTAEIKLSFDKDCPEPAGNAFLHYLGLDLRRRMPITEIPVLLGTPEIVNSNSKRYVLGTRWPYYLGLTFDADQRLQGVWICRKDLADKETKYLSEI